MRSRRRSLHPGDKGKGEIKSSRVLSGTATKWFLMSAGDTLLQTRTQRVWEEENPYGGEGRNFDIVFRQQMEKEVMAQRERRGRRNNPRPPKNLQNRSYFLALVVVGLGGRHFAKCRSWKEKKETAQKKKLLPVLRRGGPFILKKRMARDSIDTKR